MAHSQASKPISDLSEVQNFHNLLRVWYLVVQVEARAARAARSARAAAG